MGEKKKSLYMGQGKLGLDSEHQNPNLAYFPLPWLTT